MQPVEVSLLGAEARRRTLPIIYAMNAGSLPLLVL